MLGRDAPVRGPRAGARTALLAAFLGIGLAACELPPQDSGGVPEGVRRDLPLPGDPRPAASPGGDPVPGSPLGAPPDTPLPATGDPAPPPPAHAGVLATAATGEYHRPGCARLGAAGASRPFGSAFEALDAGLFPCATCEPGP